jgi:uncharacterized membrane protein
MKNLNQLLTRPFQVIPKGILIAFFVLALIGFADATYLTVEHYQNKIPPCSIGGCETVLTSEYATVFGVPVSLMGAIFYFFILVMLLLYWDTKKDIFLKIPILVSILGAVISLILIALMVFVIKAICVYCMVSDTITILLAIVGVVLLLKNKKNETSI